MAHTDTDHAAKLARARTGALTTSCPVCGSSIDPDEIGQHSAPRLDAFLAKRQRRGNAVTSEPVSCPACGTEGIPDDTINSDRMAPARLGKFLRDRSEAGVDAARRSRREAKARSL